MRNSIEVIEVRVYAESNEIGHVGHIIYVCPTYGRIQHCCLSLEELFAECEALNTNFAWNS